MRQCTALLLALLLLLTACANANAAGTPAGDSPSPAGDSPTVSLPPEEEGGGELHQTSEGGNTTAEPEMFYCGNTVTTVTPGYTGEPYSFWGEDSIALTDLLLHLSYDGGVCRCPVEYTVDTEFGDGYGVNLTEAFARWGDGQVDLTQEQLELIQGVLQRNCL